MKKSDKLSKKLVNTANPSSLVYEKNRELFQQIAKLKRDYSLNDKDLLNLINKQILIPISIFKNTSPLEAVVKYLKENLNLSFHEIASLLNRNQRTIWVTYNNISKRKIELDTRSKITVKVEIFSNRKLSVLENLVIYLHNLDYSLSKISDLINRNYKTIWTSYSRGKKKHAK